MDSLIEKLSKSELSNDDFSHVGNTIESIRIQESKLRTLRQRIEYQVRKHKLQEFRDRA